MRTTHSVGGKFSTDTAAIAATGAFLLLRGRLPAAAKSVPQNISLVSCVPLAYRTAQRVEVERATIKWRVRRPRAIQAASG